MWLCVFFTFQSKVMHISSSTSFETYISDNHLEYHFHLLSQPHPCRIHACKEIIRTQKFDFVQKNRRFVLSPEKIIYLLPTSTTIYLLPRTWAAHYNQLEQKIALFYGGSYQTTHQNNCPHQNQLFDHLIH